MVLLALVLLVGNGFVYVQLQQPKDAVLSVSFLDVGQGDAIFIEGPTGVQVLIDGGRDRSAVRQLPLVMGPLDRSIDLVLATHPDADHIAGLPSVFSGYDIRYFLEPGRTGDTSIFEELMASAEQEPSIVHLIAHQGMRLHLGGGVYADVLHPEENVAQLRDTNDASVVVRLVYGDTEFMLTGDAPSWVEDRLVEEYGTGLQSDVLKAGHHGSKTSTDALWLAAVNPETVIISAGKDNSYGHPHQDVVDRIQSSGARILSTSEQGTIRFASDGRTVWEK